MPQYNCPICPTIFFDKVEVWDHFKREHPEELAFCMVIRKLLELFNRIGWP